MEKTRDKLFTSVYSRKDFGFGLIFLGSLFLINPQYGIFDVIPDFIGLLMIYSGLVKLADLDIRLGTSRKRFFAGMWTSVGAFITMMLFLIFSFDSSTNLTISLSISVLNVVFLIPAFSNLFSGLSYLKIRCNEEGGEYKDFNDIKILTIVFILVKSFLVFAPEIIELLKDLEEYRDTNFATLKTMIAIISGIIVLALGIVWVISLKKYINQIVNDELFMDYVSNRYDKEIGCDTHLLNVRKIKIFSILCIVAYLFTLCFPLDGYLYIPEFVFGILLIFAFRQSSEYTSSDDKHKINIYSWIFIISSIAMYILRFIYSTKYSKMIYPFMSKSTEPVQFWIIFGLIIVATIFTYYYMLKLSIMMNKVRINMIDNCVGLKNTESEYRQELDEMRKKELKKKSKVVYIIQIVYALLSCVCMFLVPFIDVFVAFGVYWAYRLLFCVITIVAIYVIGSDLNDEAERMI